MRGTSQTAHDAVLHSFDAVVNAAGKDGVVLAKQLFAVVEALDGSGSLRRALTDPAREADDKAALVSQLFSAFDSRVVDVVRDFVKARWSDEDDLAASIEDAGVNALLASAQQAKKLQTVEEELFHVERQLVASRSLVTTLGDRAAPSAARVAVLEDVLKGKVDEITYALVERKVASPRGARLLTAIRDLLQAAAQRRERLVALVSAAVELSAAQRARLATILADAYGHEIQLNVAVDPTVLGGIKVQVGDEVVDGTVIARLSDARRRLVG
jgi:F-type H+-transporting ATPase subunit delta